ncbi:15412_t:CDS:2, partial [Cetraspora pellucida]
MYLSAHKTTKKLGISSDTLRRWLKQGKISAKTSPSETHLYDISSFFPELITQNDTSTTSVTKKKGFLYACVSSNKQKEDLERQKHPNYELISDIESGINFKRNGLKTLLEQSSKGMVSEVVTLKDKLELYLDIEDEKFRKTCVWGERKFIRNVIWLDLQLKNLHDKVLMNIIDESIDKALTARTNIIQNNLKDVKKSFLLFKSKKDLRQTMSVCAQNFSKKDLNHFYVSYLHNYNSLKHKHHKPNDIMINKRDLRPFHSEKKRRNNNWPPVKINCDYIIHAVSIDPGVRTPFTWYSPTKDAGKIGNYDIGRIYRLCKYMDDLISKKDKLSNSKSKRKKKKASRLNK